MATIKEIREETNKQIEDLKNKAKEITLIIQNMDRNSKEYADLFEQRNDILEDGKALFMSLRFAGI